MHVTTNCLNKYIFSFISVIYSKVPFTSWIPTIPTMKLNINLSVCNKSVYHTSGSVPNEVDMNHDYLL